MKFESQFGYSTCRYPSLTPDPVRHFRRQIVCHLSQTPSATPNSRRNLKKKKNQSKKKPVEDSMLKQEEEKKRKINNPPWYWYLPIPYRVPAYSCVCPVLCPGFHADTPKGSFHIAFRAHVLGAGEVCALRILSGGVYWWGWISKL